MRYPYISPAFLIVTSLFLITNVYAFNKDACPPMPSAITEAITKQVEVELKGNFNTLKKIAATEAAAKLSLTRDQLSEKFPNATYALLSQTILSTYCVMLSSSDMTDREKLIKWEKISNSLNIQTQYENKISSDEVISEKRKLETREKSKETSGGYDNFPQSILSIRYVINSAILERESVKQLIELTAMLRKNQNYYIYLEPIIPYGYKDIFYDEAGKEFIASRQYAIHNILKNNGISPLRIIHVKTRATSNSMDVMYNEVDQRVEYGMDVQLKVMK